MPVNRFYNASTGVYQSQFVPENLPVDLMVQALANKQKLQDSRVAQMTSDGNWNQASIGKFDTDYVKQRRQDLQGFVAESQGKDLTSPDYFRKYSKFVNEFKNDEGLKRVQQSVDTHTEFLKIQKDIKSGKDVNDYERAFFNDYNKKFNIYDKTGWKGEIQLGDTNILRGTDIMTDGKKMFDYIKASGSESIKELEGGITYKDGWKGISGKVINEQTARNLDIFYEMRAGQQLGARFDEMTFKDSPLPTDEIMKHLSPEERKEYEAQKKAYVGQQLLDIGKGFIHGESTTNKDAALNKDREEKFSAVQQPNISVSGNAVGFALPNYDELYGTNGQPGMYQKSVDDMGKYLSTNSKYQRFLDQANGKQTVDKDITTGKLKLSQEEIIMLEGIPGGVEFINGQQIPPVKKASFDKIIQDFIGDNQYKVHQIKIYNNSIEQKMRTAIDNVNGNKKYGNGISFKAALEIGESLEGNPQVNKYKELVTDMINKGNTKEQINSWLTAEENTKKEYAKINSSIKGSTDELIEKLHDIKVWKDAEIDKYSVMKNKKELIKESYNTIPEYAPVATLKPNSPTYTAYEIDKNGKTVASGKTEHVDYTVENYAQKNPQAFKVYIGNELIHPTDPRYPDPASLELVSANKEFINDRDNETKELIGQKPIFNFKGGYRVTVPDPRNEGKAIFSTTPQQYTFVGSGIPLKNYTEAKAKEAYSNMVADRNYKSGDKFDYNTLTEAGKQSYIDYTMYKNPDKAKDISKVNALTEPGQRTTFTRKMFNLESGKKEDLNIKVKKSESEDGTLILNITDKNGDIIVPDMRFKNVVEIGDKLDKLEERFNAEGLRQVELGVQPKKVEGPNYSWLKEQALNPSVPIDNSNIMKAAK